MRSEEVLTPDVQLIQRSSSEPIVVSDESTAELETSLLHTISCLKSNNGCRSSGQPFNCTCHELQCTCDYSHNQECTCDFKATRTRKKPETSSRPSSPGQKSKKNAFPSRRSTPETSRPPSPGQSSSGQRSPKISNPSRRCTENTPKTSPRPSCHGQRSPGKRSPRSASPSGRTPKLILLGSPKLHSTRTQSQGSNSSGTPTQKLQLGLKLSPGSSKSPSSSSSPRRSVPRPSVVCPPNITDSTTPCPPQCSYKPCLKTGVSSSQNFRIISKRTEPVTEDSKRTEQFPGFIQGLLSRIAAWAPAPFADLQARGSCSTQYPGPSGSCGIQHPEPSRSYCTQDPGSCVDSSQTRGVHFKRSGERSPGAGCQQLFFNKDIKKSEASLDFDPCVIGECLDQQQPETTCGNEYCPAHNEEPVEQDESTRSGAVSDAARAQYYRNKLLATVQVLQNKEETVRVQTESLSVAESRITTLNAKTAQMRRELDAKQAEISELKKQLYQNRAKRLSVDTSTFTDINKEVQRQKAMVITLQNNISVIEELYRECFYESAKQEALIDVLRSSYLDVRLMEREGRCDGITLQRCQDLAAEVDNLKMEISNFLNSSNNDSGVWGGSSEDSSPPDVSEDLQQITDQLLALRDILLTNAVKCSCGLQAENKRLKEQIAASRKCVKLSGLEAENKKLREENEALRNANNSSEGLEVENKKLKEENTSLRSTSERLCGLEAANNKLKEENEALQYEAGDLRRRVCELQQAFEDKHSLVQHYKSRLHEREQQTQCIRQEMSDLEAKSKERENAFRCLANEVKRAEEVLKAKTMELSETKQQLQLLQESQQQCCQHEHTIKQLQDELAKAEGIIKENGAIRDEVSRLSAQVSRWRVQLAESEARVRTMEHELATARNANSDLQHCCRAKEESAAALQQQLEAAHARGAELCAEARRVVSTVRQWVRRMQGKHQDQEQRIRQQEAIIAALNQQLSLRSPAEGEQAQQASANLTGCSQASADLTGCSQASADLTGCSHCRTNPSTRSPSIDESREASALSRLDMLSPPHSPCACSNHMPRAARSSKPLTGSGKMSQVARSGNVPHSARCRNMSQATRGGNMQQATATTSNAGSCPCSNTSSPSSKRSKTSYDSRCSERSRTASAQRPIRQSVVSYFPPRNCTSRSPSPTEELYSRVERLQEALCDGVRRWTGRPTKRDT